MVTKTVFSAEFIKKITHLLEEQRVMLEKQLAQLAKADGAESGTFPDYGDAEEDKGQAVADYEANISVKDDLEKTMRDVVSSLKRLDEGTYGICRYCKKPIDEKRLLARPTSSACVECKKAIVQEA